VRGRSGLVGIAACAGLLALAWAGEVARAQRVASASASDRARDAELPKPRGEDFVGSDSCRACHVEAHASWQRSWHRTMTQAVTAESVIAQFDGRALPHPDGDHVVEWRGDEYWVYMPDADGLLARAAGTTTATPPMKWQRVVMSTGSHNMQLYWVSANPGRRLVAFPFTWVVESRSWVANESTLLRPHEPDVAYSWNEVCLQCHAVAGAPRMSETAVESEVAELGIACEACHGPGRAHVEGQRGPLRRYLARLDDRAASDIVNPGRLDGAAGSEICGQCHSASVFADPAAWLGRGSDYRAGADLHAAARVVRHPLQAELGWIDELLDADPDYLSGRFWGDGMIRVSGREYNGWLETPCRVDPKFGCLSCHEMHGDEPKDQLRDIARFDDDRQCTQCHDQWIDIAVHTRHAAGSSGSRCVNCHMPHTTYGLTKAIRSHQISSPSVQETLEVGRINACNGCHLDRSLRWTARELERGWQIPPPEFADAGEVERAAAVDQLVRGDAGQRALAAWAFGWADAQATSGTDWMAPLLIRALADDYAAVRWVALRSLRSLPGFEDLDWSLAGALDGRPLDDAAITELSQRWPGSDRHEGALYQHDGGFDVEAWARDHAQRDTQVVDLRE
jgi:predicted CXXCH cytochrome family protein